MSVLFAAVLIPAALFAAWGVAKLSAEALQPDVADVSTCRRLQQGACLLTFGVTILQPALILIDHGHFQYNGIALGLSVCISYLQHTEAALQ